MRQRVILALKGACMGFADAIPGVSGGTMALILGIYERFVDAVSAVLSVSFLQMLVRPAFWRELWKALRPGSEGASPDPEGEKARHTAFLINLGAGIVGGILVGVAILPVLMERYPAIMRAFFFGLVLASIVVPWRRIEKRTIHTIGFFVLACVATWMLMGLRSGVTGFASTTVVLATADGQPLTDDRVIEAPYLKLAADTGQAKLKREISFQPSQAVEMKAGESQWTLHVVSTLSGEKANVPEGTLVQVVDARKHAVLAGFSVTQPERASGGSNPPLWYIFVCGAVAISAMILPGVSGAFLLLALGLYGYILHTLRALIYTLDTSALPPIVIFLLGILVGLTAFSRLLRWLLGTQHDATMAVLAGLMLGSLRALWPFRVGVGHEATNTLPQTMDSAVFLAIGALLVGVAIVAALLRVERAHAGS